MITAPPPKPPPTPLLQFSASHWYWDLGHALTLAGCLWLIVVMLRLMWIRWRDRLPGERFPHRLTTVSYMLLLTAISIRKFQYIDAHQPPDLTYIITLVAIICGVYGTVRRAQFTAPWKPKQ